jgi:hypothetical protein
MSSKLRVVCRQVFLNMGHDSCTWVRTGRLESPARTLTTTTALNKKVHRLLVLIGKDKRRSRLQDCQTPGYSAAQLYSRGMEGLRRLSGIYLVMQSELD